MTTRRLSRTVYVRRGADLVRFLPGEAIPDWAAALMTPRPGWGEGDGESSQPVLTTPAADPAGESGPVEHPPLAGSGSSRRSWAEFAAGLDIDVTDSMTRKDIIAAVENAGYELS